MHRVGLTIPLLSLACALGGCATPVVVDEEPVGPIHVVGTLTDPQAVALARAREAIDAGAYKEALSSLHAIIAENPLASPAFVGVGDVRLLQDDWDAAEVAFTRAAKLDPGRFDAHFGLGIALQMLDRLVDAVHAYHRALTIRPDDFRANLNLATTYLQMGDPLRAATFAEQAVEREPAAGTARVNLGAAYEQLGRFDEAVAQYVVASELMEATPELLTNLLHMLARQRRYRETINTAESLLKFRETSDVLERMGWAYFRLGDYEHSITAYRRALDTDPSHWPSCNGVGVNALNTWILSGGEDLDAWDEARAALRRSLSINPDQQKVIAMMLQYEL